MRRTRPNQRVETNCRPALPLDLSPGWQASSLGQTLSFDTRTALRHDHAMLGEPENQFSLTRAALSKCGAKKAIAYQFLASGPAPGNGGRRYHRPGVDALARNVAGEGADDHHP